MQAMIGGTTLGMPLLQIHLLCVCVCGVLSWPKKRNREMGNGSQWQSRRICPLGVQRRLWLMWIGGRRGSSKINFVCVKRTIHGEHSGCGVCSNPARPTQRLSVRQKSVRSTSYSW
ncbi:hypothetical protein F5144DRAFT_587372 [Chaetomium tenue]|uniref:Uncharacterized protein n=1 Tax=Chaetomium tenue TaxID=1854479 RepID=A0ACB7NVK2_9PEZI|nr:hypothetical protein F5144DRAFT_587372 [Chaetomium globosum]